MHLYNGSTTNWVVSVYQLAAGYNSGGYAVLTIPPGQSFVGGVGVAFPVGAVSWNGGTGFSTISSPTTVYDSFCGDDLIMVDSAGHWFQVYGPSFTGFFTQGFCCGLGLMVVMLAVLAVRRGLAVFHRADVAE